MQTMATFAATAGKITTGIAALLGVIGGISLVVGVFFGFYPARRASRLLPVDCLRHE